MVADHRAQVEELLAGYRRSREQLGTVQRQLAAVRETVTSDNGFVAVSVSATGTLIGLQIADAAYRDLRPADLAALIVTTTATAVAKASRAAGEVLAPVLPPDTDPVALLHGTADLSQAELKPARTDVVERDETFENQTWMQPGGTRDAR